MEINQKQNIEKNEILEKIRIRKKKKEILNNKIEKALVNEWPKLLKNKNAFIKKYVLGWKEDSKIQLTPEQQSISDNIFIQAIRWKLWLSQKTINVSISRQFWKSKTWTGTLLFLTIYFRTIVKKYQEIFWIKETKGSSAYRFWIAASNERQLKKNLWEIRAILDLIVKENKIGLAYWNVNNQGEIKLNNWSEIVVFIMSWKNIVWDTLDFLMVDEAQVFDYEKFSDTLQPMLLKTWGSTVFFWAWHVEKNQFYYNVKSKSENFINYIYNIHDVMKIAFEMYEKTWEESWYMYYIWMEKILNWEIFVSPSSFKTEYLLEWGWKITNFINIEKFKNFWSDYERIQTDELVFVWIDWAKWKSDWKWDRSCIVLTRLNDWILEVVDMYKMKEWGIPYPEQIEIVKNFLRNYNIAYIYADNTWIWSAINDWLREETEYEVIGINFTDKEKFFMSKNMEVLFLNWTFKYPKLNENTVALEEEMENLEKIIWKNWRFSGSHPEKGDFHDDLWDSLSLSASFVPRWHEPI